MIRRSLAGFAAALIAFAPATAADVKISALPAASALGGTEALAGVQSGATVKIAPAQVATYVAGLTNTFTATQTINPAYAGSGVQSSGLCFNSPSPITSIQHCFGYGTSGPQVGQFDLTSASSQNAFGIRNTNTAGLAAITFAGTDPWSPTPTTVLERLAIGFGNPLGYNYIESSSYDGTSNRLLPPTALQIQQTGGVDTSGGVTALCSTAINSTTLTCAANASVNGYLITGPQQNLPSVTGIPPATTVSSGGGTTSITMSVQATATVSNQLVTFANPVYAQRTAMQFERWGGIDLYNWDGSVNTYFDRINKRVGIGTSGPLYKLDVNGDARLNGNLNFIGASSIVTGSGQLSLTAGNHVVANSDTATAGIVRTSVINNQTGNNGQAVYGLATGTANSGATLALLEQTSSSITLFSVGSYVSNTLWRIPRWQFQTIGGSTILDLDTVAATLVMTGKISGSSYGLASNNLLLSNTAPTLSGTGLGTSPTITANGTAAGKITVGSSPADNPFTMTLPAAVTGWACSLRDLTNNATLTVDQTATTTTTAVFKSYARSNGATAALTASDVLAYQCAAY